MHKVFLLLQRFRLQIKSLEAAEQASELTVDELSSHEFLSQHRKNNHVSLMLFEHLHFHDN